MVARVRRLLFLAAFLVGATAHADDRLGRLTLDARLGGGVSVAARSTTFGGAGLPFFDASLELGLAVSPGRRARLIFAPDFVYTTQSFVGDPTMTGSRDVFIISIPLGFEYDIPIKRVPGLYLYPQLLVGYAANVEVLSGSVALQGGGNSATQHQGVVEAVFGARYAFRNRLELLLEAVSVPVYFSNRSVLVLYRARAGIGVRF